MKCCAKKINNDATAFLRSFSEKRGRRHRSWLKQRSPTRAHSAEQEALDGHLIDYVASSKEELLGELNGRADHAIQRAKKRSLSLQNYRIVDFQLSARQRFLSRIVEPDVFFIFFGRGTRAVHGIHAPRRGRAGVIGGICGRSGALRHASAAGEFCGRAADFAGAGAIYPRSEARQPRRLLAAGIASMLLGAMFLIRSPLTPGGVSVGVALAVTIPFAFIAVFLMRLVLRSRSWTPRARRNCWAKRDRYHRALRVAAKAWCASMANCGARARKATFPMAQGSRSPN